MPAGSSPARPRHRRDPETRGGTAHVAGSLQSLSLGTPARLGEQDGGDKSDQARTRCRWDESLRCKAKREREQPTSPHEGSDRGIPDSLSGGPTGLRPRLAELPHSPGPHRRPRCTLWVGWVSNPLTGVTRRRRGQRRRTWGQGQSQRKDGPQGGRPVAHGSSREGAWTPGAQTHFRSYSLGLKS